MPKDLRFPAGAPRFAPLSALLPRSVPRQAAPPVYRPFPAVSQSRPETTAPPLVYSLCPPSVVNNGVAQRRFQESRPVPPVYKPAGRISTPPVFRSSAPAAQRTPAAQSNGVLIYKGRPEFHIENGLSGPPAPVAPRNEAWKRQSPMPFRYLREFRKHGAPALLGPARGTTQMPTVAQAKSCSGLVHTQPSVAQCMQGDDHVRSRYYRKLGVDPQLRLPPLLPLPQLARLYPRQEGDDNSVIAFNYFVDDLYNRTIRENRQAVCSEADELTAIQSLLLSGGGDYGEEARQRVPEVVRKARRENYDIRIEWVQRYLAAIAFHMAGTHNVTTVGRQTHGDWPGGGFLKSEQFGVLKKK